MKSFRFKLQKVLELRERLEKETATRLAAARHEATMAQRAVEALEQARQEGAANASRAAEAPVSAGELQQLSILISQLEQHLDVAQQASREADEKVGSLVLEFERAFTKRQVMDKLRDKQLASWREGETRADQSAMDALALSRFTRKKNGPGDAA